MSERWKRRGLLAAAVLCMSFSLYFGSLVRQFDHTMSVKYQADGLTADEIDRLYGGEKELLQDEEELPYVTGFQRQEGVTVENESTGSRVVVTMLSVYGEMNEVMPVRLYRGAFVQKADKQGCVISLKAAEKLFGGHEVIGCEILAGSGRYLIRGILQSEEALLLIQSDVEESFPYLELRYDRGDYPASNTKAFLTLLGLPAYDSFTEGNLYAGIAGLFMGLPFFVLLAVTVRAVLSRLKKGEKGVRYDLSRYLVIAVSIVLLLALFRIFVSFTDDYIPSKVSDFQFWPELLERVKADYRSAAKYQTWYKESVIFVNLRRCLVTAVVSGILLFKTVR